MTLVTLPVQVSIGKVFINHAAEIEGMKGVCSVMIFRTLLCLEDTG